VRECDSEERCTLWPFRFGANPNISEAKRQKSRECALERQIGGKRQADTPISEMKEPVREKASSKRRTQKKARKSEVAGKGIAIESRASGCRLDNDAVPDEPLELNKSGRREVETDKSAKLKIGRKAPAAMRKASSAGLGTRKANKGRLQENTAA
jgi:hypothetical protein